MSLGFVKEYDTSLYGRDEFMEIWPEISEIGLEISEAALEHIEPDETLLFGAENQAIAYIKGCLFMLGFSEVDRGFNAKLYDEHTSSAVVKAKFTIVKMGRSIEIVDSIDTNFVQGLIFLFNKQESSEVSTLFDALAKARTTKDFGIRKDIEPETKTTVKQQIPKPSADRPSVKSGIDLPVNMSLAQKSVQYSLAKDGNKQLSPNFTVAEFKSKDGSDTVLVNPALVDLLEKIRKHFNKPIDIISAYRTPRHNARLSGAAKNSQHMYGNAADIKIQGVSPKEIYDWLNSWHQGGLGLYPTFTHVDVRNTVGKDIARWGKSTGDDVA